MSHSHRTTHYRACNLCEAICGLAIEVEEGRIVAIRGDGDDPLSRGHICPKAVALQDIHSDPDRLRHPVRRTASGWQRVSWDEALEETAERLATVQAAHGNDAVGLYLGNPNVHNYGSLLFGPPLYKILRTRNRFSATSVDQLPHHLAAWAMFGHQLLLPVPDVDRTDFFLVLGANPLASNGSLMTAPGMRRRIQGILGRGGRVVVVDPRRTETARLAGEHHFIRPGTDALFLLALLATLFEEGLARPGELGEITDGLEELRRAAEEFSPERVAAAVGMDAAVVRKLARDLAAAERGVAYGRIGLSTQEFGGLCQWLINALNLVTGHLDRPGGALISNPAVDLVARSGPGHFDRYRSRVRGLPEFAKELPVAVLAEEILTPGEGQIRAVMTVAGNPVLSTPNGRQLDEALGGLDFMVSMDLYVNETTRHAHLILPPTAALEHDHYDLAFHALAVRNTSRYSPPLFDPEPDSRHDWQIFLELGHRLARHKRPQGAVGRAKAALRKAALGTLGPAGLLDLALRSGPYGGGWRPWGKGLTLRRLRKAPHGVDLGPLEPSLGRRLAGRGRRIQAAPEIFVADLARLAQRLEALGAADGESLLLVGRRQVRSNNSWMHNSRRLMKGKPRCTLLMHPEDAQRLGLEAGSRAVVRSRVGEVEVPVETSDEMMPGVVSLPHGWGHDRAGVRLEVAREQPGVSLNDLTDDLCVDQLSGNAVLSGVPVQVEPAGTGEPSREEI